MDLKIISGEKHLIETQVLLIQSVSDEKTHACPVKQILNDHYDFYEIDMSNALESHWYPSDLDIKKDMIIINGGDNKDITAFVHSLHQLADRNTPVVVLLPNEEGTSLIKKIQATKILLGETGCNDLHKEINKIFMQRGYPRTLIKDDIKMVKRMSVKKVSEILANINLLTKNKISKILKRELSHLKKFHLETYDHGFRVSKLFGKFIRFSYPGLFSDDDFAFLALFVWAHDIGKRNIEKAEQILNKNTFLNGEENYFMRFHPIETANIIRGRLNRKSIEEIQILRRLLLFHHERWDGTGYYKIGSEKLPVIVRLVMLCDIFDAMISPRLYKEGFDYKYVKDMMLNNYKNKFFKEAEVKKFFTFIEKSGYIQ